MHFSRMCDALVPEPPGDLGPNHPGGAGVWNECVYGCMNDYKERAGVGNVTLMIRVMGFEELQSEMFDRVPCSSFVTESAWPTWGHPFAPYLSLGMFLCH